MSVSSRRIRQETSLSVSEAKEAAAAADRQLRESRSSGGNSVPQKIDITGGSKGGTLLLITSTLFIGYLYFTRRLPSVLAAIQNPGSAGSISTLATNSGSPPTNPSGTIGTPGINPYAGFIQVKLTYPDVYRIPPETITVDPKFCKLTVYGHVVSRTGSAAVATAMSNSMCP